MKTFSTFTLALLSLLLFPRPARTQESPSLVRSPDSGFDFRISGSAKTIANLQYQRHTNIYSRNTLPQAEERLWVASTVIKNSFMLEFTQEASAYASPPNNAAFSAPTFNPVNAWDAQWNMWTGNSTSGVYRIARLYAQLKLGEAEFRVGKQVIATGVGKIFAAINQVPRLPLTMIDQEYQRGEDAVSVVWGRGLVLEARYLPKVRGQSRDNFHFRTKAQRSGYDIGFISGRSDDKIFIGLEIAGNLGEDLIRGEVVGFHYNNHEVVQALLGFDYVFGPKWSMTFETFYNGMGDLYQDYRLTSLPHRSTPYRGKYYGALSLAWETTDRLKTNFTSIVNILDPSTLLSLSFNYSLGNNLDLLVGQYLSISGRPRGEFGGKLPIPVPAFIPTTFEIGLPDISYAAIRWYF